MNVERRSSNVLQDCLQLSLSARALEENQPDHRETNQKSSTTSSSTSRHAPVDIEESNQEDKGQCPPADDHRGASQTVELLPTHTQPPTPPPPVRFSLLGTLLRSSRQVRTLSFTSLWNPVNSSSTPSTAAPSSQRLRFQRQRPSQKPGYKDNYPLKPLPPLPLPLPAPTPRSHSSLRVNRSLFTTTPTSRPTSALPHPPPSPKGKGKGKGPAPRDPPTMTLPFSSNSSLHTSLHKATSPIATPPQQKDPELGHLPHSPSGSHIPPPPSPLPWGPSHPCYPHPNPHVPLSSPLYASTRVIRIPRDWMIVGDLAPTFSNIYPEILDPWVSESQFRRLIKTINERLTEVFRPGGIRAWADAIVGLGTGWLLEDLGGTSVKRGCKNIETWIEGWNREVSNTPNDAEGQGLVRCVPLRRTGYMSVNPPPPKPSHILRIPTYQPTNSQTLSARHPNPRPQSRSHRQRNPHPLAASSESARHKTESRASTIERGKEIKG